MVAIFGAITGNTTCEAIISLPASTTIPFSFNWISSWVESVKIEDDWAFQLNIRKIRYKPFHIRPKTFYKSKTIKRNIFIKQIMPKPKKIGSR